jgi:hypothetical protein
MDQDRVLARGRRRAEIRAAELVTAFTRRIPPSTKE